MKKAIEFFLKLNLRGKATSIEVNQPKKPFNSNSHCGGANDCGGGVDCK